MHRLQLRAPKLRNRPLRARRAIAEDEPLKFSIDQPAPLWMIVGTGIVCGIVAIELIVGLVVIW